MSEKQTAKSRDWQKRIYLEAFRAANPGREGPIVNYESGWWVFRVNHGGRVKRRVRTKEFAEMTFSLEQRAKEANHVAG